MLKILAILALFYFFFRSVGFVIRMLLGGATTRNQNTYRTGQQKTRTREGLHVDSIPKDPKQRADFKGGDYVDYEELD